MININEINKILVSDTFVENDGINLSVIDGIISKCNNEFVNCILKKVKSSLVEVGVDDISYINNFSEVLADESILPYLDYGHFFFNTKDRKAIIDKYDRDIKDVLCYFEKQDGEKNEFLFEPMYSYIGEKYNLNCIIYQLVVGSYFWCKGKEYRSYDLI